MTRPLLLYCAACVCLLLASDPAARDWPMWGGTADRNMGNNVYRTAVPANGTLFLTTATNSSRSRRSHDRLPPRKPL